ncbi:hypothetical protein [Mesorhizobium sp.]|uniref:DUF6946 family protein n=1 Tax=Mesorhizobium sp. TaxID=1871066 RepID=UPI000FE386E5|nr:hypothetical protein [Mesorhizobium sp.]RWG78558.1 MAG: hypothetical protein EOQ70_30570 [Mesorhizobium sp.]RWK22554.1 MAG: hypothetical protein EOR41_00160 [Mesorhizobium sp.]
MARIYLPSQGTEDWRRLLADPVKHWREGYSAMCLAQCWESAGGLPSEIARLLISIGPSPELLVALPEHKVPLPGSRLGDSQNDLFALIRAGDQTVAVTIEGKVDEPFDQPLGIWLANASDGKRNRLAFICDLLGLTQPLPDNIRYQLLHRTASAVIEARRFKTDLAAMIVHSFSPTRRWFEDYAAFVALFGATAGPDQLVRVHLEGTPRLYVGWASGKILDGSQTVI